SSSPPALHDCRRRYRGSTPLSFQLDLAFDLVRQADTAKRDRARGEEFLVALEFALRQSLADGLLDLALRAHPRRFEKFAHAAVEDVFVHDRLLLRPPLGVQVLNAEGEASFWSLPSAPAPSPAQVP